MTSRAGIGTRTLKAITTEDLTAILAERVMGWSVGLDRFLMSDRSWKPRWKLRPTKDFEDAFRLLEAAKPFGIRWGRDRNAFYRAQLRMTRLFRAEASGSSLPFVICMTIANAYGVR